MGLARHVLFFPSIARRHIGRCIPEARKEHCMLRLALLFLVIALIAGLFGFPFVAGMSYDAARIFFFIFLVLAVLFFLGNLARGDTPRDLV
jgi:uncharacterized membrane protein YtjA (UPF0391 family)